MYGDGAGRRDHAGQTLTVQAERPAIKQVEEAIQAQIPAGQNSASTSVVGTVTGDLLGWVCSRRSAHAKMMNREKSRSADFIFTQQQRRGTEELRRAARSCARMYPTTNPFPFWFIL